MLCPYCVQETTFQRNGTSYVCAHQDCKIPIHRDYVEKYRLPRATVGLLGYTGHGKTAYLTSLFYLLYELSQVWEDYFCSCLDDHTIEVFSAVSATLRMANCRKARQPTSRSPRCLSLKNRSSFKISS